MNPMPNPPMIMITIMILAAIFRTAIRCLLDLLEHCPTLRRVCAVRLQPLASWHAALPGTGIAGDGIAGDSIHHSWAQFGRYLLKSPDISNTRCDQAADCSATSLRCTGSCHMRTQLHCQRAN